MGGNVFLKFLTIGILVVAWTPYETTGSPKRFPDSALSSDLNIVNQIREDNSIKESDIVEIVTSGSLDGFDTQRKSSLAVVYDSSGIDKPFQMELVRSVFVALRELDEDDLNPEFIDVAKFANLKNNPSALAIVAARIASNRTSTVVSLLKPEDLYQLSRHYNDLFQGSPRAGFIPPLKIFTPRLTSNVQYPESVSVYSLQMSQKALSIALLNRVEKVGIRTLIPVLDENNPAQLQMLDEFISSGQERMKVIKFTRPIFINEPAHLQSFKDILNHYTGFSSEKLREHDSNDSSPKSMNDLGSTIGVMMLASSGSHTAMKIAAEKKHMQIGWFSPNILQHEEWAYRTPEGEVETSTGESEESNSSAVVTDDDPRKPDLDIGGGNSSESGGQTELNPYYGLYTVGFVGSTGWDNPARRRVLRELASFSGASPRVLSSVLSYDSALLAATNVRKQLHFPMVGLSGEIGFDPNGFRRDGVFFGVSAVPDLSSASVTLLQPSTWILEDTISIMETLEGQFLIREYEVATSSILTGEELRALANHTKNDAGCIEHLMSIVTHDPYNQMPYNYFFKEANLPESLLIPNQHGFGIDVLCIHDGDYGNNSVNSGFPQGNQKPDGKDQKLENETLTTTLQVACTPGIKISDPIKCYRSHMKQRQRRSPADGPLPETQYQYSFGGSDLWSQPQNTKWSNPKDDAANSYYYQSPAKNYYQAVTPSYANRRADSSLPASAEVPTTTPAAPSTAGAPATSKLPELRQILKAAKPFVGSCIGATTGCAMCVLVLGRLPLGAVPAACTGPCFVGTFGSCGSLLGRVFSETTVICTELFRQGIIDTETFVADAEFGQMMLQQFPETLQGYQLIATPVVEAMQKSALVTNLVSTFALPWAHHMKYLMGRTNEPSLPGLLIHTLGVPLCSISGQIYTFYSENFSFIPVSIGSLILATLLLFIITLFIKSSTIRRGGKESSSTSSAFTQHLYVILGRSQELFRHVFTC